MQAASSKQHHEPTRKQAAGTNPAAGLAASGVAAAASAAASYSPSYSGWTDSEYEGSRASTKDSTFQPSDTDSSTSSEHISSASNRRRNRCRSSRKRRASAAPEALVEDHCKQPRRCSGSKRPVDGVYKQHQQQQQQLRQEQVQQEKPEEQEQGQQQQQQQPRQHTLTSPQDTEAPGADAPNVEHVPGTPAPTGMQRGREKFAAACMTIKSKTLHMSMSSWKQLMGSATDDVFTVQLVVDGVVKGSQPDVQLSVQGRGHRQSVPLPKRSCPDYGRYRDHTITGFTVCAREQQQQLTVHITSQQRAAQQAATLDAVQGLTGMRTHMYQGVRGGHHVTPCDGANLPVPKKFISAAFRQAGAWTQLPVELKVFRNGTLIAEVPDAVVRTKDRQTWVYITEKVKSKVLGCRLWKAVAGNPARVEGAGSSNILEVYLVSPSHHIAAPPTAEEVPTTPTPAAAAPTAPHTPLVGGFPAAATAVRSAQRGAGELQQQLQSPHGEASVHLQQVAMTTRALSTDRGEAAAAVTPASVLAHTSVGNTAAGAVQDAAAPAVAGPVPAVGSAVGSMRPIDNECPVDDEGMGGGSDSDIIEIYEVKPARHSTVQPVQQRLLDEARPRFVSWAHAEAAARLATIGQRWREQPHCSSCHAMQT